MLKRKAARFSDELSIRVSEAKRQIDDAVGTIVLIAIVGWVIKPYVENKLDHWQRLQSRSKRAV